MEISAGTAVASETAERVEKVDRRGEKEKEGGWRREEVVQREWGH